MPNVSDDFNRTDVSPLDGSWAGGYTGSNNLQIVGNEVRMASTAGGLDCIASHTTAQGNDQWSKATLVTFNDAGAQWIGEIVRLAAPTTFTGYGGGGLRNFGGNTSWIIEWTTGTPATLVAETATTWAATDKITQAVRGTILNLYRNGGVPLLTITDASNASGRIGQHCYSPALATAEIDNFLGGELPITVVGTGAEASAASGGITLNAPSGTPANNDVWIAMIHSSDQVAHTLTDWTQIVQGNGGGTTSRLSVWYHRYAGSTPNLVVGHTAGQSPIGGIISLRGCKTSGSPVNVAGTIAGGTDASIEHNGVSVTVDGSLLLAINGSADDNNRTLLSGWTNILEDSGAGTNNAYVTTAGTPDGSVSAFYVDTFIGSTGTVTVTQAAADAWASVLIVLEPQVGGPLEGAGSSTGLATVTGVGQAITKGSGASNGLATVTGVGRMQAKGAGAANGIATAEAHGAIALFGVGSSTGLATVSAVGQMFAKGAGSSAGLSTVVATGQAIAQALGSSAGLATVAAIGHALTRGVGSSDGIATVVGIIEDGNVGGNEVLGAGLSQGVATVLGVGQAFTRGSGLSQGIASVSGVGQLLAQGSGLSQGIATVQAFANAIAQAAGTSAGIATVTGFLTNGAAVVTVRLGTGIPNVQADNTGRLWVTETITGVAVPCGIPGVLADSATGAMLVTFSPVAPLYTCGIPGVLRDSTGAVLVTTSPTGNLQPTGIPGVFADATGAVYIERVGSTADVGTGIPNVYATATGRLRVSQ